MVSLFVSLIQIAWIKGPLCRQIKLCQGAYVVAGKILQKASGLPFPDCFLLPGQKKDFSTPRETSGMVTWSCQTAIAPSPSWAAHSSSHTPGWFWDWALPELAAPPPPCPFFLLLLATASDWQINRAALIQNGKLLACVFLCMAGNVSEKNVSDGRALQSLRFCIFPF